MRTIASMIKGLDRPPVSGGVRRRLGRLAALALVTALAVAAFVLSEPALRMAPTPPLPSHRASNPTWAVAPSIEEQIFRSTTIVRATLQSATAAVETRPGDPGVAPTYLAVQELRFTVHEYLKGSGPTDLLVVVRGRHANPVEAEAREYADHEVRVRVTTWDDRQAVLFLEAPSRPYTPAGGGGEAAGSSDSTAPAILAFTRSNHGQPPWAYSVDTLRPAWLPAENMPAEGEAPTAFITDGTQAPPPAITLADLRARIAALAAELKAGEGVEGFRDCVLGRIGLERSHRADPWTPYQETGALTSGAAAGTEGSQATDGFSGSQVQPLLAGAARTRRCSARPSWTPTVSPAADTRTSFAARGRCPPVSIEFCTDGSITRTSPATSCVTTPTMISPSRSRRRRGRCTRRSSIRRRWAAAWSGGTRPRACWRRRRWASPAARRAPRAERGQWKSATLRRLTWDAGQLRLDVAGTTLAGQQLELIRLDGTVGLTLRGDAATRTATAGGHELRWPVCSQPWQPGERLMLRISPAPAGNPPAAPACPSAPALPTVTVDATTPAAGATATLTAAGARRRRRGDLPVAARRGRRVDAGGRGGRHLPGARLDRHVRHLAGAGPLCLRGPGPLGAGHADLAGGGHGPLHATASPSPTPPPTRAWCRTARRCWRRATRWPGPAASTGTARGR